MDPFASDSDQDSDHDSLTNLQENEAGTDPLRSDTDRDTFGDAVELALGFDPLDRNSRPSDADKDGWLGAEEALAGTDADDVSSFPSGNQLELDFETGLGEGFDFPFQIGLFEWRAGFSGAQSLFVSSDRKNRVRYSGGSTVSSTQGSVNLWVSPDWDSGDTITNSLFVPIVEIGHAWRHSRLSSPEAHLSVVVHRETRLLGLVYHEGGLPRSAGFEYFVPIQWEAGQWYHLSLSWGDDGLVKLYVDAKNVITTEFPGTHGSFEALSLPYSQCRIDLLTTSNLPKSAEAVRDLFLIDLDGDQLPDVWERRFFGDLAGAESGSEDTDGDGLSHAQEAAAFLNPLAADTDGDALTDDAELALHGTDPRDPDTDADGLHDGAEIVLERDPLALDIDVTDATYLLTDLVGSEGWVESHQHLNGAAFSRVEGAAFPYSTSGAIRFGRGKLVYPFTVTEAGLFRLELNIDHDNQHISYENAEFATIRRKKKGREYNCGRISKFVFVSELCERDEFMDLLRVRCITA